LDPTYVRRGKAFDRALKLYEKALAKKTLLDELSMFIVTSVLLKLPPDDVVCIKALDTSLGKPDVFIRVTYNYLDDKYSKLAESAQENLRSVITRPLSFETSLDGNFSSMKSANAILTAKGVGFTENQLLREACTKLSKNPRTKPLVEDFKKRDAYNPTTATFTVFSSWAVTQYDNRSVPDGTAAFAFRSDSDYCSPDLPSTPAKSADPVAAATVSPAGQVTLTAAEIDAVIEARKKSQKKTGQQSTPPGTRKAPGWCTLHGYGTHGPGFTSRAGSITYCRKMSDKTGAPLPGYTLAQVTCTNPIGPPVDGMVRSQAVTPGFSKP
jgi:hypothetical protein